MGNKPAGRPVAKMLPSILVRNYGCLVLGSDGEMLRKKLFLGVERG